MNLMMALAVFIVVVPAIMTENLKNMVPALFIGSGAYFGLLSAQGAAGDLTKTAISVLLYCAVGQVFGYITVFWRGKYEASLARRVRRSVENHGDPEWTDKPVPGDKVCEVGGQHVLFAYYSVGTVLLLF